MHTQVRYFEDYEIGEERVSGGRTITEADVVLHAGQTGDFYPHHMDAEWSRAQGFGQRVAHGTLILSIAAGMLADVVNTAAFSYGYDKVRFVRPVFIGDTIRVRSVIAAKRDDPRRRNQGFVDEQCTVSKQDGTTVLAFGHVYLVDRRPAAPDSSPSDRAPADVDHH